MFKKRKMKGVLKKNQYIDHRTEIKPRKIKELASSNIHSKPKNKKLMEAD